MMTTRSRFLASSSGSAAMPSSSGISTSSTTTSGSSRSSWLTASRPVRKVAASSRSGSASTQRANRPRTTTASSTIMTRMRRPAALAENDEASARLMAAGPGKRSDQADFLEFRLDDLLVERLHDVLVGAGVQRARDVRDVVLGGAEHHLGSVAAGQTAQRTQKLVAVHLRHIPVEQDRLRQLLFAGIERLLAVLGLHDLEFESFENSPRHLADDAGVVDDQTGFHHHILAMVHSRTGLRRNFLQFMPRPRAGRCRAGGRRRAPSATGRRAGGCRPTRAQARDRG